LSNPGRFEILVRTLPVHASAAGPVKSGFVVTSQTLVNSHRHFFSSLPLLLTRGAFIQPETVEGSFGNVQMVPDGGPISAANGGRGYFY
jgi:hypothetical protein